MNKAARPLHQWKRCPFLGLRADSSTSLPYPSPWNHCYRSNPPGSIAVSYQAKICLCPDFVNCALNPSTNTKPLAHDLRGGSKASKLTDQSSRMTLRLIELFLLAAILILFHFYARQILP